MHGLLSRPSFSVESEDTLAQLYQFIGGMDLYCLSTDHCDSYENSLDISEDVKTILEVLGHSTLKSL